MSTPQALQAFADWVVTIRGDEAREAQTYVNRLLQAWGWADAVEAGTTFEYKIPKGSLAGGSGSAAVRRSLGGSHRRPEYMTSTSAPCTGSRRGRSDTNSALSGPPKRLARQRRLLVSLPNVTIHLSRRHEISASRRGVLRRPSDGKR